MQRIAIAAALVQLTWTICCDSSAETAARKPGCPADPATSQLVTSASDIIVGELIVDMKSASASAETGLSHYTDLRFLVDGRLKGDLNDQVTVHHFQEENPWTVSDQSIADVRNSLSIISLVKVDGSRGGYYFVQSPDAIIRADQATITSFAAEIERQRRMLDRFEIDESLPQWAEVRRLVSRLGVVSGERQQQVFDELIKLGPESVPAIIAMMDDRRELKTKALSLENKGPHAFEAFRHYGPELVVDGLAAVLNQITGLSFSSIYNGGSERERVHAVNAWRVYAADLGCPNPPGSSD